jgi:hypothetical protein
LSKTNIAPNEIICLVQMTRLLLSNSGAIPTVVRGNQITTSALSKGLFIVLPFLLPVGEFHIEIVTETPM